VAVARSLLALGAAVLPRAPEPNRALVAWHRRRVERRRAELARARLRLDPRLYEAIALLAPPVALMVGWAYSPLVGLGGMAAGFFAPRALVATLTARQRS